MHIDWIFGASLLVLVVAIVLLQVVSLRRREDAGPLQQFRAELLAGQQAAGERLERELRDEVARSAVGTRQELSHSMATFQQTLFSQQADVARTQNEQSEAFRTRLSELQHALAESLSHATASWAQQAQGARTSQDLALAQMAEQQANGLHRFSGELSERLQALSAANDQRMGEVRLAVEQKLGAIQLDNERKLEQMRATVDEKLHATLEQRLGESFKQVADRLEQVHKGLGEMQLLARDVGSLNRVLTNVKTRGIFGEVQLAGLLEQVFTPAQYGTNVETVPGSGARVEFAISLPGQRTDGVALWLPIDAKFPRDDYERLLEAQERADPVAVEASAKAIEQRLRAEARSIREKYVSPPHTTDFGILFVPTEGLYAEALRRPGLMESLQREHRVLLAGPTTLLALLNSLQMGFRTLALEQRSVEVWEVLGAVKTEFGKFGDVLVKTRKKLDEARNHIDMAERRTRVMAKELNAVEALPQSQVDRLLPASVASSLQDETLPPLGGSERSEADF
jgi:DNA recombination protein RmuC